jgi:hypothetical protein
VRPKPRGTNSKIFNRISKGSDLPHPKIKNHLSNPENVSSNKKLKGNSVVKKIRIRPKIIIVMLSNLVCFAI